ncbi:MAG: HAD-IC family P-type ATPase [Planctomycetes bacterium]|nr:HAD-IC family P-type ATPase [Planctomycetota bacterium]
MRLDDPATFANRPGEGVCAEIEGRTIRVGSAAFLRDNGIEIDSVRERLDRLAGDGQTVVLLAVDDTCAGLISVADRVRPDAARAVEALCDLGLSVAMITGDLARTSAAVARSLGISEVEAEMTPQGKLDSVKRHQQAGERVAFVGDGINDAPALAAADVGITFASATDVATGAADITIVHDFLDRLPTVIKLARRSVRIIKQNLFWAFFYNALALPLAATGRVSPGIAAAAMMFSSISVVLNSLRLASRRSGHEKGQLAT